LRGLEAVVQENEELKQKMAQMEKELEHFKRRNAQLEALMAEHLRMCYHNI
jgi:cell division septum initiation protein DivIVA